MEPTDFTKQSAGHLIRAPQGYWAYLPNSLPPELSLDWDLVEALNCAERELARLSGSAHALTNPLLLIRPFVRREAILSSKIEGTQASLSDLFFFESSIRNPEAPADVQEVSNYVTALEFGLSRLQNFPLSLRFVRELHEKLMGGLRGDYATPGEFRRSQNWIGPAGCTLNTATFVPPPVPEMQTALNDLEHYLHAGDSLPVLIKLALIHYQFECIHPFLDGNGRVGRLLIPILLCHHQLLEQPLLYLSAYFEKHRQSYYSHLLAVSREGAWHQWILFFLRGVAEQSRDGFVRAKKIVQLNDRFRKKVSSARASALLPLLVDHLFNVPLITIPRAAEILGVTTKSASLNVGKLVDLGILSELKPWPTRLRVFTCKPLLKILNADSAEE